MNTSLPKINILYLIDNLKLGGAQKIVLTLSEGLDPNKYRIYTISMGERGPFYEKFKERGQYIESLDITSFWKLYRLFKILAFAKKNEVTLIHSFLFYSNFFGRIIGKAGRVPLIICSERATGVWKNRLFRLVEALVKGFADYYTAVSEATKRFMVEKEGIPCEKVVTLYNGVDIRETATDVSRLKLDLGIPPGSKVIGTVGRLADQKGYEYLIKAFKLVNERHKEAVLVIVGGGPLEKSLKDEAVKCSLNDKIVFTGPHKDPSLLMDAMDIYVISSWFEGMSNSLLEAMAKGLPVVATDIDGNREVVVDGETGLLVPPRDEYAIAEALNNLLSGPSVMKAMGLAGKKRIEDRFTTRKMLYNYNDFYTKILKGKGMSYQNE